MARIRKTTEVGPLQEAIYNATPLLREPAALLLGMVRDLSASRHLAFRLLLRNLRSQYRQSLFGYVWVLAAPLAATGGVLFLSKQNVLRTFESPIPYGIYIFSGLLFWQIFTDSYQRPVYWLTTFRSIMGRVKFPHEALIVGALSEVILHAVIRLIMLAGAIVWIGWPISPSFLYVPLAVCVLIGLGLVVGLVCAPIGMLYGDVERGMNLLMVFWFLVTPVIYPPPSLWPASLVNQLNPVAPLVVTARELALNTNLTQLESFLQISGVVVVALLLSWVFFRLAISHLVARFP